jgi:uncharacterized protein YndB with AHSA1/START domain
VASAVTEADQLVRWLPDQIAEVDLRPGGPIRIEWQVEFTLEAVEDGTCVVVESGSSKVREEKRESAWHDNDGGWAKELGELKSYLEAA